MGNFIIKGNSLSSLEEDEDNPNDAAGDASLSCPESYRSEADHVSPGVDVQPPARDCHLLHNAAVTQHVQPPVNDCHSTGSVASTQHGASFNHSYTSPFSSAHSIKQQSDPGQKKTEPKSSALVNGDCRILSPEEMDVTPKMGSSGNVSFGSIRKRDHRSLDRHKYSPYQMSNRGLPLKNSRYSLGYMPVIKLNPAPRHTASLSSPRSGTVYVPSPDQVHIPSRRSTPATSPQRSTPSTLEVMKALAQKMPSKRKREDNSSPVIQQQNQIQPEVGDGVVKKRRVVEDTVQTPKVGVDEIMEEVFNRTILKKESDLRCNRSLNAIDSSYTSSRFAEMLRKHTESTYASHGSTPSLSRTSVDMAHSDIDDSISTASESKVQVKPLSSQLKRSTNQSQEWFPTVPKHSTSQDVQSPAGQSANTHIKLHFPMEPPISGFWATPSDVAADKARDEKRLRKLLDIPDEETIPKPTASVKTELVMPIQCPAVMPEGMTVKVAPTEVKKLVPSVSVQKSGDSTLEQKLGSSIACAVSAPLSTASATVGAASDLRVTASAPLAASSADDTVKSNVMLANLVATDLATTSVNFNSNAVSGIPSFNAGQQAVAASSKPNIYFQQQATAATPPEPTSKPNVTTATPAETTSIPNVNFGQQTAISTASNSFGVIASRQSATVADNVNIGQPATSASSSNVPSFTFGQQTAVTTATVVPSVNAGRQATTSSGPGLLFGQQSTTNTALSVPGFNLGQPNTPSTTAGSIMNFNIGQPAATSTASGFNFGQQATTATTSTGPSLNFGQQTTAGAASITPGFTFGQAPKTTSVSIGSGLGFGLQAPTCTAPSLPGFSFGQQTAGSTASGGITNFSMGQPVTTAATSSAAGFGFGQQSSTSVASNTSSLIFGQTTTSSKPATTSTAPSFDFGQKAANTAASNTGFVFGQQTAATVTSNVPNFNIGQQTTTATTSTGPSFSSGQQATTTTASTGLIFGQQAQAVTNSSASNFNFGQQTTSTASTGPSFNFTQQAATTTTASNAPVFGFGQQVSSTTASSVPGFPFGQAGTTAGSASVSSLNFGQTDTTTGTASASGFNFGPQTTSSNAPGFNFGQQSSAATLPSTTPSVFGQKPASSGFSFGANQPLTNGGSFSGTGFGGGSTNPSPAFGASTSMFGGDRSNPFTGGAQGIAFGGTQIANQSNAPGFGGTSNGFMNAGSSTNPSPAFGASTSMLGGEKSNPFASSAPSNVFGGSSMTNLTNAGFGGASNGMFNTNSNNGSASPAAPMFSMGSSRHTTRPRRRK